VTRAERWLFHASNVLVAGTGGVYAWMLYALEPADEYALVNHELQPTFQHLHVWFAPLLVLMAGVLWRAHVAPQLRSERRARRRSGLALLALLLPMVLSGYSIQVVSEQTWRNTWVSVHVASSVLWCVAMLVHLVARARVRPAVAARSIVAPPEISAS
jgi:hypothetical protein